MAHHAKKSLGQNFLRSGTALRAICDAGNLSVNDIVLEIGPGKGALTEVLLESGAKIIAIEKDRTLMPYLSEKFEKEISSGQFELIERDVLEFDPKEIGLKMGEYKLIANIPYYITGAILEKFLEGDILPEKIVFLVQKEVSDRIVARDKKESILSVSVKAFGTPKYVMKVSKKAFTPSPKVDSAILLIENISHKYFVGTKEEKDASIRRFFDIVHAGFAHKRKLLSRNLEKVVEKELISKVFTELGISVNARAEDLPIEIWLNLAKSLSL